MCGGRGTRLDASTEKPLTPVAGRPLVDRVLAAVRDSGLADVYAVTSPHAPATRAHVEAMDDVTVLDTPGEGYVADLQAALDAVGEPVCTVAADLPLIAGPVLDDVLAAYDEGSLTVAVPASLVDALGFSADTTFPYDGRPVAPSGVNVVGGDPETTLVSWDARLAANVNYPAEVAAAERLLSAASE